MNEVHAPYHFVPLSKWVYMPDWAHLVSHDHPFEDGYSGVIEYTLTNATALCVGDKQIKEEGKPTLVKWARDPSDETKPVIPGSSLKGMIRNILEIASFGKFSNIDDNHFSYRDISNTNTKYAKEIADTDAQAYWLKFDKENQEWTLTKTNHTTLFHDEFNQFTQCKIENIAFKQPAEKKYKQWPLYKKPISFNIKERKIIGTKDKEVNVVRASDFGNGQLSGYPIFSSFRPGNKKHTQRRLNFSYIFYNKCNNAQYLGKNSEIVQKLFSNHDEALVKYLQSTPHPEYGIPVFSREKNNIILAIGFAKMPRKLYDKSVHDTAKKNQSLAFSNNTFDLAELMMGTLRDSAFGIKGRISFTDAKCNINNGIKLSSATILGQPKASYLSAYLEQNADSANTVRNELNQYDTTSKLKGWKRYPAQNNFQAHLPSELANKVNVQSQLELLIPQSQFMGKIFFHNLKKVELGALLWVLRLQKNDSQVLHSLGHGKPLGAGSVSFSKLNITASNNIVNNLNEQDLIQVFQKTMHEAYPSNQSSWQESPQIKHLLSFSNIEDSKKVNLKYMPLSSRDPEITTYTNSVSGRTKQILPKWSTESGPTSRDEDFSSSSAPSAYAKGRLSELLKITQDNSSLQLAEEAFVNQISKQKKQQEFESQSKEQQLFIRLKEKLSHPEAKTNKDVRVTSTPFITELLDLALTKELDDDFLSEFYQLCLDTTKTAYLDLGKKKKDELKRRKALLTQLAEKYQLKVNS